MPPFPSPSFMPSSPLAFTTAKTFLVQQNCHGQSVNNSYLPAPQPDGGSNTKGKDHSDPTSSFSLYVVLLFFVSLLSLGGQKKRRRRLHTKKTCQRDRWREQDSLTGHTQKNAEPKGFIGLRSNRMGFRLLEEPSVAKHVTQLTALFFSSFISLRFFFVCAVVVGFCACARAAKLGRIDSERLDEGRRTISFNQD